MFCVVPWSTWKFEFASSASCGQSAATCASTAVLSMR
jgi:hypothetical protein